MSNLIFDKDNLPDTNWYQYRKIATISATKIAGPFTVQFPEGYIHCSDGYLAIDTRGYPYPIDTDEFEFTYEEVK